MAVKKNADKTEPKVVVELADESVSNEAVNTNDSEVQVDTETIKVKSAPSGDVKIRMRSNHTCTIAMIRYDLEAGKTYVVPENVKKILDGAGLLAPLS